MFLKFTAEIKQMSQHHDRKRKKRDRNERCSKQKGKESKGRKKEKRCKGSSQSINPCYHGPHPAALESHNRDFVHIGQLRNVRLYP